MKLTTTTQVSVDGVMQGPGGPEENRSGGFERGGWAMAHFDNEAMTVMDEIFQRADAFLFGRRTYEIFAGSWGTGSWGADQGDNPISVALNTMPKYVASTTLTDPQWADTTVLSGDVAAAVGELKAKPGRELQVHGCGALTRWLLDNDLVDEMNLFTCPVVVGQGTRLFPDTGPDTALDLVDIASHPQRDDDPGLPARRPPTVRNGSILLSDDERVVALDPAGRGEDQEDEPDCDHLAVLGDRLPVELDDVAESFGVVAAPEAEPLGADPVLVRARRASLYLLVSPCLEDRRHGQPWSRRDRADLLRRLEDMPPLLRPELGDRPPAPVGIGLVPEREVSLRQIRPSRSSVTSVVDGLLAVQRCRRKGRASITSRVTVTSNRWSSRPSRSPRPRAS